MITEISVLRLRRSTYGVKGLGDSLQSEERAIAETFIKLIYSNKANTAHQYMFVEAILRVIEETEDQRELNLDRVFLEYSHIAYTWCVKEVS